MSLIQKAEQNSTSESSKNTTPTELPDWFDPKEAEAAAEELCKKYGIEFQGGVLGFWFNNDQKPRESLIHGMLMLPDKTLRYARTIVEAVKIGKMFGLPGIYEYDPELLPDEAL